MLDLQEQSPHAGTVCVSCTRKRRADVKKGLLSSSFECRIINRSNIGKFTFNYIKSCLYSYFRLLTKWHRIFMLVSDVFEFRVGPQQNKLRVDMAATSCRPQMKMCERSNFLCLFLEFSMKPLLLTFYKNALHHFSAFLNIVSLLRTEHDMQACSAVDWGHDKRSHKLAVSGAHLVLRRQKFVIFCNREYHKNRSKIKRRSLQKNNVLPCRLDSSERRNGRKQTVTHYGHGIYEGVNDYLSVLR